MNGQLSEHPLGELIRELCEKGLSGSLRLQQERSKVVVYLEDGRVIYAASNVRRLRLAEYLKKHQLVTEAELTSFVDKNSDLALAAALSEAGIVRPEIMQAVIANVVSDVLHTAMFWTEGTWSFEGKARLNDSIRLEMSTTKLLLESARKAHTNFAEKRFPNPHEVIAKGVCNTIDALTPTEGFLLSRVEADITVGELVAVSGLCQADAMRAIYGLALGGYLKRERWQTVLRAQTQPPSTKRDTVPVVASPPVEPQRTQEDDLKDFLDRMDSAANFYDVLNVGSNTPAAEVKQQYYALARKYHPDRFRGIGESMLHVRLESAFARVTQAYETLMDSSRRTAYDTKLTAIESKDRFARTTPKATGTVPDSTRQTFASDYQAENSFTEGLAALEQGQIKIAVGLLAAAARAVPNESRYRAYYGRALAANSKTRHSAEVELQAAIRLEPSNAAYRVMLAELYRDLGFSKRAQGEAKRALGIEPGNAPAKELLKNLK